MAEHSFKNSQLNALVLMRLFIGWHFLYEGTLKLFNSNWTSKAYLLSAEGFMKPFFVWLGSDSMINMVDMLNIICLLLVGLTLLLGYLERTGAIAGIILLLLYYLAHPAFPGMVQVGTEGSYWIINKNLIEAAALLVIYQIPTANHFGLARLFKPASVETITSN